MTETAKLLAIDLGAESGRAVLGHLDGGRLHLEEVHRFANGPVNILGSLHWDALRLWSEIQQAIGRAAAEHGNQILSLGLDTWGVDFGLLAADGTLLGQPYHYRDSRTDGMLEVAFRTVPRTEIYAQTGIQFMQLNSLFQLLSMVRSHSPALDAANTFLNMPDLFNFWLSGQKASEFTISTTSQCYNPVVGDWAFGLLNELGIPDRMFGPIVPPGTALGPLHASVAERIGGGAMKVIASAGHDTASAVAAVPAQAEDYIFLSSGTWSLMGVEVDRPIINEYSLAANFTNEGGVGGVFRFLRNIMGLWLVQECRRTWAADDEPLTYDHLTQLADQAPAFGPLVDPGDHRFLAPGDMPLRIQTFCRDSGQTIPETRGQIVRTALESLALEYRWTAERLDEMVGRHLPLIHIIGGGSQNELLNQLTADATGRTVVAGPIEATAIGNILVQAMALGLATDLSEGRQIVNRSFKVQVYEPQNRDGWDEAYTQYRRIRSD